MRAIPGVVQNTPHLTPGVENDDFVVAITRSDEATSWSPAAATSPLTTDTTGKGNFLNFCEISPASLNTSCTFDEAANSLRSCPEENTVPSDLKNKALIFELLDAVLRWLLIYVKVLRLRLFLLAALERVIVAKESAIANLVVAVEEKKNLDIVLAIIELLIN